MTIAAAGLVGRLRNFGVVDLVTNSMNRSRRIQRRCLLLLGVAALCGCVALSNAVTVASAAQRSPVKVKPDWQRVPGHLVMTAAQYASTTGRYEFLQTSKTGALRGVLIDDRTGSRRPLTLSDGSQGSCDVALMGGPWIVTSCGRTAPYSWQLYNIPSSQRRPLTFSPALNNSSSCGLETCVAGWPTAIGTRWVQIIDGSLAGIGGAGGDVYAFQNLQTGQVMPDPTRRQTTVNLDSSKLAAPLCKPLTMPIRRAAGSIIDEVLLIRLGGGYWLRNGQMLQRCGTHLHWQIPQAPLLAADAHAVIWANVPDDSTPLPPGEVEGTWLTDHRRFTIAAPKGPKRQFANSNPAKVRLAMTNRAIYLSNGKATWRTPVPKVPHKAKAQ